MEGEPLTMAQRVALLMNVVQGHLNAGRRTLQLPGGETFVRSNSVLEDVEAAAGISRIDAIEVLQTALTEKLLVAADIESDSGGIEEAPSYPSYIAPTTL